MKSKSKGDQRMNDPERLIQDSNPPPKGQKPKEPFEQVDALPDAGRLTKARQRRGSKIGAGPTNPV
jgi:hypothetical protein